jgi:hypothetical protein
MTRAVVGLFNAPADAQRAIADMIEGGFRREKISLISPDSAQATHVKVEGREVEHIEDMAIGAVGGGLLAGIIGVLVGNILLGIPGLGPLLEAGPLGATLGATGVTMVLGAAAGALLGGILGALTWASITTDEARFYEAFVQRGGALVMVQAARTEEERAAEILHRDGALDAGDVEAEWRREGLA